MTAIRRRRWEAGQTGMVGGIPWRVVQGYKRPDDLRLEFFFSGRGWVAVKMEVGFLLADFFFENEEVLYPRENDHGYPTGRDGGLYYLRAATHAAHYGWEAARDKLGDEKRRKREREDDGE